MGKLKLRSDWKKLSRTTDTHTLEARIFHVACLFTILLFSCSIVFNYALKLYAVSLILIPGVVATFGVYYLSKVKCQHRLGVNLFCLLGNVIFIGYYFNNSGINGPGFIIYLLFFFLVMSITPKYKRLIWVAVNSLVAFSLLAIQYVRPELMPMKFQSSGGRYLDFAYVYFFTLIIIFFIITHIIDSYNTERLLAVKRAEELELSNQSKTKLFSILAHDLKSPLNSIQGFLEVLQNFDLAEEERRAIKSTLLRETKNTGEMLINLLSWSKTQMEGTTVRMMNLNLRNNLESTVRMKTGIASEKSIALHNKLQKDVELIADGDMLQLVIRNILSNAIKFTPSGGEITISSEIHGKECWIIIQDTGVGISSTTGRDIFSMQSGSTYGTNNEKGVGLGLVLCKEFIDVQNGRIWMESTVGVGTTFFVSLDLTGHGELFTMNLN